MAVVYGSNSNKQEVNGTATGRDWVHTRSSYVTGVGADGSVVEQLLWVLLPSLHAHF